MHLMVMCQLDLDLCLKVLRSWVYTMTSEGWIAKEQARGEETQFGIPIEFLGVEKNLAVPPTLILVVRKLLDL